eukprot:5260591-Prymnesium_polylepis.1
MRVGAVSRHPCGPAAPERDARSAPWGGAGSPDPNVELISLETDPSIETELTGCLVTYYRSTATRPRSVRATGIAGAGDRDNGCR